MKNLDVPAFPLNTPRWHEELNQQGWLGGDFTTGMTLRDYFAAQALTGAQVWDAVLNGKNAVLANGGTDKLAEIAYAVADAMLEVRK